MKLDLDIDRLLLIGLPIESHRGELIGRLLEEELTKRLSGFDGLIALKEVDQLRLDGKAISVSSKTSDSELVKGLADSIMSSLQVGQSGISEGRKNV
ncbi:MAG: hypothetical protein GTO18_18795 [Anaerolineales bacterium]|nr:hypothetical protein [Anaerolineales bacterium]